MDTLGDDPEAFEVLFRDHGEAIYNYCFRRTANWAVAQDLNSQVFLAAWQARRKAYPLEGSFAPWLYGIANNVIRTWRRGQQRGAAAMRHSYTNLKNHRDRSVESRYEDAEHVRSVLDQVDQLPKGQQDVFFLVLWEGLDYAAAAAALEVPVGTVRSRLSRVRAALRLDEGTGHGDPARAGGQA